MTLRYQPTDEFPKPGDETIDDKLSAFIDMSIDDAIMRLKQNGYRVFHFDSKEQYGTMFTSQGKASRIVVAPSHPNYDLVENLTKLLDVFGKEYSDQLDYEQRTTPDAPYLILPNPNQEIAEVAFLSNQGELFKQANNGDSPSRMGLDLQALHIVIAPDYDTVKAIFQDPKEYNLRAKDLQDKTLREAG
jgi:hypothetical protein